MKKYKILLDTDIGDDIDDLLCLQLALQLEQVELVGITTVFKNTNLRARMVKKVLQLNNIENIPVYAGSGNGVERINDTTVEFCQSEKDLYQEKYNPINDSEGCEGSSAIDFIVDCAKKYKEELIILAIGPYTNIAKAIIKDSEAIKNVGRIVVMGGNFYSQFIEWNSLCDVEAIDILTKLDKTIEYVSADVTHSCFFDSIHLTQIKNSKGATNSYVAKMIGVWQEAYKKSHDKLYLHDALALMYIVEPSILEMEEMSVAIEKQGDFTRGMTLNLDLIHSFNPSFKFPRKKLVSKYADSKKFVNSYLKNVFDF